MQPELMLLDEVTAALDRVLVGEILNVIRDMRELGMTMILATHEMGFAREISDLVCFLKDGVILEAGAPTREAVHGAHRPETAEFRSVSSPAAASSPSCPGVGVTGGACGPGCHDALLRSSMGRRPAM